MFLLLYIQFPDTMSTALLSTSEEAIKTFSLEILCRIKQRSKSHLSSKGKTSHGRKGKIGHTVRGTHLIIFVINIFRQFFEKAVAGNNKGGKCHMSSYLVIWVFLQLEIS